jgi:hypothetical protein
MRLHQFTDESAKTPKAEDDIDAMGEQLVHSLRSIAGRLQQFIALLDEACSPIANSAQQSQDLRV